MAKLKNDMVILLITLIAAATVIVVFILYSMDNNPEWLGFWGSSLGAVIAISGIYWQFNKQKLQEERKEKLGAINYFIMEFQRMKNDLPFYEDYCSKLFNSNMYHNI